MLEFLKYGMWALMEGIQYRKYVDLCNEQFSSFYIAFFSINLSSEVVKDN